MKFVTADSCRIQLEKLTQLLVSAFPGSTVYQHADLSHVAHDALNNKVDAVLLEAETDKTNSLDLVKMLHRKNPELPVFIIAKTDDFREKAVEAGADGCFVLPDEEQRLLETLRLRKTHNKKSEENVL